MPEPALSIIPFATIQSYDDLLSACRAQVCALELNYSILDQIAGFADGYSAKLLAHSEHCSSGGRKTKRHFSPESFDAYMTALGLDFVAVENPEKIARLKSFCKSHLLAREGPVRAASTEPPVVVKFARSHIKRIARLGGLARARKMHARAELSETKRRAALARWRKRPRD